MSVQEATTFSVAQLNAAITALGGVPTFTDESAVDALSGAWGELVTLLGVVIDNQTAGTGALQEFADNLTAVAGGLAVGQFYRTGDAVKQVHP